MNKYNQWYSNITERAKNRNLGGYTESHHIHPRSLGGSDEPINLVELTAREHFICHWLLVKMTTGQDHHKMLNALRMMRAEKQGQQRYNTKITARVYESIKQEYAELQSKTFKGKGNGFYGKTHTEDARRRISEANKGRVQPLDEKERQRAAITGRQRKPFTEEHKTKMSVAKQGENNSNYGKTASNETRKKIGDKIRGRKQTPEEKLARSLANIGKKRKKKLCPHCKKEVAVNGYARWHGPACRARHTQTA